MSRRLLVAVFSGEHAIRDAARDARERGYTIAEAYTPYAVHGLDTAMGLRPTRFGWLTFVLGAAGAAFMMWYQLWMSSSSWPLNVGGKPYHSVPAFVPVTFELMVLLAGVGSVVGFLAISRLWPGRRARIVHPRSTDDSFVLVLVETDAAFDAGAARELMLRHGALSTEERLEESMP